MCAAADIPQRKRYLLFQWHYEKNHFGGPVTWIFRESPTPWGPWTPIATFHGPSVAEYYNPCLISKFIEDDGLRLWIATNGQFGWDGEYNLKTMPVTLWTDRSLKLSANHLQFSVAADTADPCRVDRRSAWDKRRRASR